MASSKIEWTDATWNPVTGCSKFSIGCINCYAERMALRLQSMGVANYKNGFDVTLHHDCLATPLSWKSPKMVFVNSMSDIFHEDIPLEFIKKIFVTISLAKQHTFQLLTKRAERLQELQEHLPWPKNLWMGVTVEHSDYMHRVDILRSAPAHIKFLSLEPLLSPIHGLDLSEISWVIVGGESGPSARGMDIDWVRDIRDQCIAADTPFFFKQWGGTNKKKAGRELDGKVWDQWPKNMVLS
ncbi:DUF5131 family protein [Nitratidesulfovibrio vulgaris]|uniref:DUF5131 family protein n=1 Tax=Nitratidesulfovibrio vulgaris TaxID=881 RepID=UPI00230123CC|nr:phage Gp37/Gp68 family protein [Nitratidesulfovibrio vulgaris]WCB45251.1 phage Gp37/Gp68 family protein [Nitratidesulfovibrio vulgaris]